MPAAVINKDAAAPTAAMSTKTEENAKARICPARRISIRICKVLKRTRSNAFRIVAAEPSSEPTASAAAINPHDFSSKVFIIHVGPALPRKPLTTAATSQVPSPTRTQLGSVGDAGVFFEVDEPVLSVSSSAAALLELSPAGSLRTERNGRTKSMATRKVAPSISNTVLNPKVSTAAVPMRGPAINRPFRF